MSREWTRTESRPISESERNRGASADYRAVAGVRAEGSGCASGCRYIPTKGMIG